MGYLSISYSEEVEAPIGRFSAFGEKFAGCQDSESHLKIRAIDAPTPSLPRPSGTVGSNFESAGGTPRHSFDFLYSSLPIHFLIPLISRFRLGWCNLQGWLCEPTALHQ
jgi:hypothetical protein